MKGNPYFHLSTLFDRDSELEHYGPPFFQQARDGAVIATAHMQVAGLAWFIGHGIQFRKGAHKGRLVIPGRFFGSQWKEIDPSEHEVLFTSEGLGVVYQTEQGPASQVVGPDAHNCVVYSNPAIHEGTNQAIVPGTRRRMTVRVSYDEGKTSLFRCLYPGPSGYSDMIVLDDKSILCGFEGGTYHWRDVALVARFNIRWLEASVGNDA